MIIQDIIDKKRQNKALTKEEIEFFVNGYTNSTIQDYEASALLMAIAINSMNMQEITDLTMSMAKSGEIMDLSSIKQVKADKHSTGGVSDTTTLIIMPILACLGIKMAKMSGRSLGFTGGTIDKLEAIPNFNTDLPYDKFIDSVNRVGACIIGQSKNIAPADKKIYALRDVTATVKSIPLIASSIMSKKIAGGADIICLDVKYGDGAFMKNIKDASHLANVMIDIGNKLGKKMIAIISSMNQPLGNGIGCNLEIKDAISVLLGENNNLAKVSKEICAQILMKAFENVPYKNALNKIEEVIENKTAFNKLLEIVANQGGDISVLNDTKKFKKPKYQIKIFANQTGYITSIRTEELGEIVREIGGGRLKLGDQIMHEVGIFMTSKLGQRVKLNDILCELFTNKKSKEIEDRIVKCFVITNKKHKVPKLIAKVIN